MNKIQIRGSLRAPGETTSTVLILDQFVKEGTVLIPDFEGEVPELIVKKIIQHDENLNEYWVGIELRHPNVWTSIPRNSVAGGNYLLIKLEEIGK